MRASRLAPLAAALSLTSLAPGARTAAQPQRAAERGAFVALVGADTFAVERFARVPRPGGDSTTAELLVPRAGARVRRVLVDSGALLPRYLLEAFAPGAAPDAAPAQRASFRFMRDTAFADVGGAVQTLAVRPGTLPWLNPSFVLVEQIVRRARAIGGDRVEVPMVSVAGAQQFVAAVERVGRDSAVVRFPDAEMRVAVDDGGRVTGLRIPAQNLIVARVARAPE